MGAENFIEVRTRAHQYSSLTPRPLSYNGFVPQQLRMALILATNNESNYEHSKMKRWSVKKSIKKPKNVREQRRQNGEATILQRYVR